MKRLLVTGASGFLGWNICEFPQEDWEIIGLYNEHADAIPDYIESYQVNLTDAQQFERVLEKSQADAVLHLAANSSPKDCEQNPSSSYLINVGVSVKIAELCKDMALPLLFASSEQVYSGNSELNSEEGEPAPINAYGMQKLKAEQKLLKMYPPTCIARLAVMYGHTNSSAYCFMHDWLDTWKRGEEVSAFNDEIRSFLSGYSAAEGIFLLLERQANGIFNLGGKDSISRFEFAQRLAAIFDIKDVKIKSLSQNDIPGLAEKRPTNLTLDLSKIEEFGFIPRGVAEELVEIRKEIEG